MDILSDEQTHILNIVKTGDNVIVDAVAGTGKTTLILSIAKAIPNKKIMQMTYNSSLRIDVKKQVEKLDLTNIKVHTFHSLATRYYSSSGHTDTEIRRILFKELPPLTPITKFDILVLDECQDMTFLYFQFMAKFVRDADSPVQLLILGDYMQGLYEFKGADIRFLTLAEVIWSNFSYLRTNVFQKCGMKMSYRITNQMCSFVNKVMLGEDRMSACRDGPNVTYIRNSRHSIEKIVSAEIGRLIESGVKPCEIFILGPSVKGASSNIRQMENTLVERNIPCHVPMLENDKIDERVIGGKLVFSTFHCVKGRQRKYVFVVGFDNSYPRFYARNIPRDICPNTLYVASTRASVGLYLLENDSFRTDRPLEFLKMSHIQMKQCNFINFRGQHQTNFVDIDESSKKDINLIQKHVITPTDLIKFIPESVINEISPVLDRIFINESWTLDGEEPPELDIPTIIETKRGLFEEVSDLNGIAIPCIYYDYLKDIRDILNIFDENLPKNNVLLDVIHSNIEKMKPNDHIFLKDIVKELPETITTIDDYLYISNVSVAVQERLYFKLKQIDRDEYNWLTDSMVSLCKERLNVVIGVDCTNNNPRVEETIIYDSNEELHANIDAFLGPLFENQKQFRFTARVDLITENVVWELKCTSELSIDHLLQVVIYAWLWNMRTNTRKDTVDEFDQTNQKTFKIFNIKTGKLMRLEATMDDLHMIMVALLKGRYQEQEIKTDEEFIFDCQTYLDGMPDPKPEVKDFDRS